MTRTITTRTLCAAFAAVLATACASTGDVVQQDSQAQSAVPEGQLGMLVEDLIYGSPEERVRAATDIASQGERGRDATPFLIDALEGDQPQVRAEAARALSMVDGDTSKTVPALTKALESDDDEDVLNACSESLGRIGGPAVDALIGTLESHSTAARALAAQSLGVMGEDGRAATSVLVSLLRDSEAEVRTAAAKSLGRVSGGTTEAVQPLVRSLDDEDAAVRAAAAWSLGEFGDKARWTTLSLVNKMKDESPEVRMHSARALGKMGPSAAQAALDLKSAVQFDSNELVRREAAEALRRIANEPSDDETEQ